MTNKKAIDSWKSFLSFLMTKIYSVADLGREQCGPRKIIAKYGFPITE